MWKVILMVSVHNNIYVDLLLSVMCHPCLMAELIAKLVNTVLSIFSGKVWVDLKDCNISKRGIITVDKKVKERFIIKYTQQE